MRDDRRNVPRSVTRDVTGDTATTGPAVRDRLMLAFTELAMYGIAVREDVGGEPGRARAEIAAQLALQAPDGLGSYVFRCRADDHLDAGIRLYTSGPEADRAVVAACAHHGVTVRPGPEAGVLLAEA